MKYLFTERALLVTQEMQYIHVLLHKYSQTSSQTKHFEIAFDYKFSHIIVDVVSTHRQILYLHKEIVLKVAKI